MRNIFTKASPLPDLPEVCTGGTKTARPAWYFATVTMVVLRQTFMALKIDKCLIVVEGLVILLTILNKYEKKLTQK